MSEPETPVVPLVQKDNQNSKKSDHSNSKKPTNKPNPKKKQNKNNRKPLKDDQASSNNKPVNSKNDRNKPIKNVSKGTKRNSAKQNKYQKNDEMNKVLTETQIIRKQEIDLAGLRFGSQAFRKSSTVDETVFVVSSLIIMRNGNGKREKISFSITIPEEYPASPIKLGKLLTPRIRIGNAIADDTENNDANTVPSEKWNKTCKSIFNRECEKLCHVEKQPLVQQLNWFIVNFDKICFTDNYNRQNDLKKKLILQLAA